MRSKTRVVLLSATLSLGLCAAASVRADGPVAATRLPSYLGVYALPLESTSVDGEITVYGPIAELRFEVSLTNEEGSEPLNLAGGVASSLQVDLRRDQVPVQNLAVEWSGADERYSFSGEELESTAYEALLRPGEGMKTELVLRRKRWPFAAGAYVLTLTVVPQEVRSAGDLPWRGRGGVGGSVFRIREVETLEDRKNHLSIEGSGHLQRGELQEALAVFTELESLDPADPMLCAGKGVTLFRMRDYAGAAACFDRILPLLAVEEAHSTIPRLAAHAYAALGDKKRAREAVALYVVESRVDAVLEEISRWAAREGR